MPNSTDPASSAAVAATSAAGLALLDSVMSNANGEWLSLLSRSWQSYADFGPQVGIQLLNGQPTINAASLATGVIMSGDPTASSSGVVGPGGSPVSGGSSSGSGPGGSAPGSGGTRGTGLTPDDLSFSRYFGTNPEFKTYTGPLPKPGSSMSLIMGGQNRALPVGAGRYPAATPNQLYGNPRCATPTGVATDAPTAGASVLASSGWLLAVLGVLALAGLAEHESKKRGRV
jgi:hypothetical protein